MYMNFMTDPLFVRRFHALVSCKTNSLPHIFLSRRKGEVAIVLKIYLHSVQNLIICDEGGWNSHDHEMIAPNLPLLVIFTQFFRLLQLSLYISF